ncbi:FAD-dependent oxidoreductase, partial [Terrabacter sp. 2RAF25]|uniref:FAD-dependent oxidoreductase n=1 Tax=Terrabacter sp. 2RAF25 TaxID=3232998 RepID=UPI003F9CE183
VELGGLNLPPNFHRSEAMLKKAKAFLPALKTEGGVQWMGFRPSLPDSLPAIGRARATPRVTYAFGHGHLGKAFLPALKTEGGVQWMGFRPSLPDSLPAIGRARATPRVTYAFGHGHLG